MTLPIALLLPALAFMHQSGEAVPCREGYLPETIDACAMVEPDGSATFTAKALGTFRYDKLGRSAVSVGRQWYYVRADGRSAPVMTYDNGPESFTSGLARSPRGGKIGFIDRELKLVIPARYDGALPFDGAQAVVCTGCRDATDGEHHWYAGGTWQCIDTRGRQIGASRAPVSPDGAVPGVCTDTADRP